MTVYEYLYQETTFKPSPDLIDLKPGLFYNWSHKSSGTTMPPSPAASFYSIKYMLDDMEGKLFGDAHIEWRPWVKEWFIKHVEPWQITHRSRSIPMGSPRLLINEVTYRINQFEQLRHYADKIRLTPEQSERLFIMNMDTWLNHFTFNQDWINRYIADHKASSMGGGYKWNQAILTREEWLSIYENIVSFYEYVRQHPGTGHQHVYRAGIRARDLGLAKFSSEYHLEWDRSRSILFLPMFSIHTMFTPQKASLATQLLENVAEVVKPRVEFIDPYSIGGSIYLRASEMFASGKYRFSANDGRSWETLVGYILGPAFKPFLVNLGGIDMLPSGESNTSFWGSSANYIANAQLPGKIIGLGDDMNYFSTTSEQPSSGKGFIEYQPEDTLHKYILGVAFDPDPLAPRLSGLRACVDRARKVKSIPMGLLAEEAVGGHQLQAEFIRKTNPALEAAYGGMYKGRFGKRSLIEALADVPGSEYTSPGELLDLILETKFEQVDPFAYAEEVGIKNVFLA